MSTILQITGADPNLSSMTRGIKGANLEDTLNELGPFTILAPVNLAFSKLSPAAFEELLKKQDFGKLSDMMGNHIIKGKKMMKDFRDGQKLTTLSGKEVNVTVSNDEVRINGSKILSKDRQGSNGVIHSVDMVNTH
ncbi:MAG: fasciclin domain-containing protein [Chitinophagales bacterium]